MITAAKTNLFECYARAYWSEAKTQNTEQFCIPKAVIFCSMCRSFKSGKITYKFFSERRGKS